MVFIFFKESTKHRPGINSHGWCGVCLKDAKSGEYGHCPYDGPPTKEKKLITRVKTDKHWGFCSNRCNTRLRARQLKETKLTVLPNKDCTRFANTSVLFMNSDAKLGPIELCAGKKTVYPTMKVFIRKKLRKVSQGGKRYIFKYKEDKINTVRVIHK